MIGRRIAKSEMNMAVALEWLRAQGSGMRAPIDVGWRRPSAAKRERDRQPTSFEAPIREP
jgi:hypothetical protein